MKPFLFQPTRTKLVPWWCKYKHYCSETSLDHFDTCFANGENAFCNSSPKVHGSSVPESFEYSLAKNKSVGYLQVQGDLFSYCKPVSWNTAGPRTCTAIQWHITSAWNLCKQEYIVLKALKTFPPFPHWEKLTTRHIYFNRFYTLAPS